MKHLLSLLGSALVLGGCVSPPTHSPGNGAADAHKDISENHIQLMETGTIVTYTPGVTDHDPQFRDIPRTELPGGCTNPNAMTSVRYAEHYNAVMIAYLLAHPH